MPSARGRLPSVRTRYLVTATRDRRKVFDQSAQEPAEPDGFAPPLDADAIHAVVPVAAAHQWQPVCADGEAVIDRARAMFVQRCPLTTDVGNEVGVFGANWDRLALEKRHRLFEHTIVAADFDIVHGCMRQPQ